MSMQITILRIGQENRIMTTEDAATALQVLSRSAVVEPSIVDGVTHYTELSRTTDVTCIVTDGHNFTSLAGQVCAAQAAALAAEAGDSQLGDTGEETHA